MRPSVVGYQAPYKPPKNGIGGKYMKGIYPRTRKVQVPAYLYPEDYEQLVLVKESAREEYGVILPLTEILRDAARILLEEIQDNGLEEYLQAKQLLEDRSVRGDNQ